MGLGKNNKMSEYLLKRRAIMMGISIPDAKPAPKQIPKLSQKKIDQLKVERPIRDDKNKWFAEIEARECKIGLTNCWNCGEQITRPFMRAATAHILPKRKGQFPSVATHPLNYLILGAGCGCHTDYDRSWNDASEMNIWPLAIERFKEILPDISEEEKSKIPQQFLNKI